MRFSTLLVSAASLYFIVACSSVSTPTSAPAASVTATAIATSTASAPTPTPTPAPTPAPKVKVLRIGRVGYPDAIDPQTSAFGNGVEILKLAYEGLLTVDETGNVGPGAAEKCDMSADGTSMTCTIRAGLKRDDGSPITAKDFEYALKRAVDPRVPDRVLSYLLSDVKGARELDALDPRARTEEIDKAYAKYGVMAIDERTLVVTFIRPDFYWQMVAASPVTFPTDETQVDKNPSNWWSSPPGHNGNGPFKVESIDPGKKIVLVANASYWRGRPKLDRIELIYYSDFGALLAAYKAGDIDMVSSVAPDDVSTVKSDPALKSDLVTSPAAMTYALAFNTTRKPFDDINVRTAFSQAFDRAGWLQQVKHGIGKPYTRLIPPGVPGAASDKPGVPVYDPSAAVQTLVTHGYADKDSSAANPKVDCGKLGAIKLFYNSSANSQLANFQFLAANFSGVLGCPITLEPVDPSAYRTMGQDPKTQPQISVWIWVGDYPHPHDWLNLWTCGNGFSALYGYCNKDMDALVVKADGEPNVDKSLQMYRNAEDLFLKDVPAAFAGYAELGYLIKPYVIGPREYESSSDLEWPGEWGPVWSYDVDLSIVPANYGKN